MMHLWRVVGYNRHDAEASIVVYADGEAAVYGAVIDSVQGMIGPVFTREWTAAHLADRDSWTIEDIGPEPEEIGEVEGRCEFCKRPAQAGEKAVLISRITLDYPAPAVTTLLCVACGFGIMALLPMNERHETSETMRQRRIKAHKVALASLEGTDVAEALKR